jgi:hypothetical protein
MEMLGQITTATLGIVGLVVSASLVDAMGAERKALARQARRLECAVEFQQIAKRSRSFREAEAMLRASPGAKALCADFSAIGLDVTR